MCSASWTAGTCLPSASAASAPVGPVTPAGAGGGGGGSTPPAAGGGGTTPSGARFFRSPLWRTLITDLDSVTITLLDRRMFNRSAAFTLNGVSTFSGSVASDDPRVSRVYDGDGKGDPAVAEGTRLLYCFRQEDPTGLIPWTIRFAGPVLNVVDRSDSDRPVTDIIAYDPWQYLYSIPVLDASGLPLGADGAIFPQTRGSFIAAEILYRAILGVPDMLNLIDLGTIFWGGTIEDTATISNWQISQGTSVGQAWDDLVATGSLDIVLTPIYDPVNRPGVCSELSIFSQAGHNRFNAVFGWDTFTHSLTELTREQDGKSRANVENWYAGTGGIQVNVDTDPDPVSVAKYGAYWQQTFRTDNPVKSSVALMARAQLQLEKNGRETITLQPAPERGPFPFTEWYLGDCVFPYATAKFRKAIDSSVGAVVMSNIAAAGTGWSEGDTGVVDGGDGNAAFQVDSVDGSGGVVTYRVLSIGSGYTTAEGVTTTGDGPSAGTGFTLNIGTGQRIYALAVEIDDNSVETVTPALTSQT